MQKRRAIYAGSFDPPHLGHVWLAQWGAGLFDELVVAIGHNPEKRGFLAPDRRAQLMREACAEPKLALEEPRLKVVTFSGKFTVDLARELSAQFLVRGIRSGADVDHEQQHGNINRDLAPEIMTVFLMPPRELCDLSSSFVRGLIGLEGWQDAVARMVPANVLEALIQLKE